MRTVLDSIRPTRQYLVVTFTIRGSLVAHKHVVRVPWRALNEQYEEVANAMANEAVQERKRLDQQLQLPLETWE